MHIRYVSPGQLCPLISVLDNSETQMPDPDPGPPERLEDCWEDLRPGNRGLPAVSPPFLKEALWEGLLSLVQVGVALQPFAGPGGEPAARWDQ